MQKEFTAFTVQEDPSIIAALIPGKWLLKKATPSWRVDDPEKGFQRRVSKERAEDIAVTVLDQQRTFPNAIVLATDARNVRVKDCTIAFPDRIRFLVIDGQHRLWAQHFSKYEAVYCCLIHFDLSEEQMAALFVEINDNQKRVPSSLRWDLVRLVKPDDDPYGVRAVDLIYELNNEERSPLYQRIDLTGEQKEISLKQGSLAPEIKRIISKKGSPLHEIPFDDQFALLSAYFSAVRECDADGWDDASGPLYGARVLRALIRLLPNIMDVEEVEPEKMRSTMFAGYLELIDLNTLDRGKIVAQQGSAGIKAIYDTIVSQVFE